MGGRVDSRVGTLALVTAADATSIEGQGWGPWEAVASLAGRTTEACGAVEAGRPPPPLRAGEALEALLRRITGQKKVTARPQGQDTR